MAQQSLGNPVENSFCYAFSHFFMQCFWEFLRKLDGYFYGNSFRIPFEIFSALFSVNLLVVAKSIPFEIFLAVNPSKILGRKNLQNSFVNSSCNSYEFFRQFLHDFFCDSFGKFCASSIENVFDDSFQTCFENHFRNFIDKSFQNFSGKYLWSFFGKFFQANPSEIDLIPSFDNYFGNFFCYSFEESSFSNSFRISLALLKNPLKIIWNSLSNFF